MPIIPFADPGAGLMLGDWMTVQAIMYRPSDPDMPRTLRLLCEAEGLAQTCDEVGTPPDGLGVFLSVQDFITLARAEPLENLMASLAKAGFGGAVAGDLLLFILICAEWAPEHASLSRAIFVRMADLVCTRLHSGKKPPAGRSELYDAWREFKPVAHLWGAFRLWQNHFQDEPTFNPRTPTGLLGFLALAEQLHARAVSVRARGQTEPVLNPSETWRVPVALALPEIPMLQPPPLTDWARARLEEYKEAVKERKKPVK